MNSPSDSNMAGLQQTIEISKDIDVNLVSFASHEQTNLDAFQIPEDSFRPTPITSRLLATGVPHSVAEAISNAYLNHAFQLKEIAEGVIMKTCAMLGSLPSRDQTRTMSSLKQHVIQYISQVLESFESLAQERVRSFIAADGVQASSSQMRRRFKAEFLPLFEFAFSKERFPSREDKRHLARISGMSYRQVSVWFQNRRCRDGKRACASPEPQTLDEVKARLFEFASSVTDYYQRNNEERDDVQFKWKRIKCNSPAIIDLTIVEEKRTIEDSSVESENVHNDAAEYDEEKFESKQISSNDTPCVSRDISMNSDSSLFPTPYIPSVPNSDPFTLRMDASLWQRRRGPKRPRASERDVRIEDIISEMGSMEVLSSCDKFNTRPVKPLPRRSQASVLPITTSPLSIPRRSFSFSSESSTDELAFSPLSRTSSTVASSLQSPESFEVNLPTLISDTSSSEYSEGESLQEDRCLHEGFAPDKNYSFDSLSLRADQKEVEQSSCAERRCSIGLDFGLSDLPTFQPESPEIKVSSWNGLLAA